MLGLTPVLVYGSHTGAAIAAELAARQASVVRAVMLDGFPIFNEQERAGWFGDFIPTLIPDKHGGHFVSVWTRARDQSVWFPWSYKKPDHLLGQGVASVTRIQATVMSIMRCGRTYLPAFESAVFYGPRAPGTLARISQPTMIACAKGDPLSGHLNRLPRLKSSQSVSRLPTGVEVRALRDEWLARHAGDTTAPVIANSPSREAAISMYNAELPDGQVVFMRIAGEPSKLPLVLIHDAPGSSRMHEPLITALAQHFRVYAVDLPGCGESDPLPKQAPTAADFVDVLRSVMAVLGIDSAGFLGVGTGSSVALAVANRDPLTVRHLFLQSLPLPGEEQRQEMALNYAPPIELKSDGSHWYSTWLMLRDSLTFWPWYKSGSAENLRKVDTSGGFDADHLHDWTVEVIKQSSSYHQAVLAALAQDSGACLARCHCRLTLCDDLQHPFATYEAKAREIRPDASRVEVSRDPAEYAAKLASAMGIRAHLPEYR